MNSRLENAAVVVVSLLVVLSVVPFAAAAGTAATGDRAVAQYDGVPAAQSDGTGAVHQIPSSGIIGCGVVDTSGEYSLQNDISNSTTCLTINASNVTLDGNGFEASGDVGIHVGAGYTNVTVKNVEVGGNVGLQFNGTDGAITDVTASGDTAGILIDGTGNLVSQVSANSTYGSSFGIWVVGDGNVVEDSTARGNAKGLVVDGSSNTITYNRGSSGSYEYVDYRTGFDIRGSDNTVTYNNATNPGHNGIVIAGTENTVTDNTADGSHNAFVTTGDANLVANNTASNLDATGLEIGGLDNVVRDNVIDDPGQWGLRIYQGDDNTVARNVVVAADQYEVYVYKSNNNSLLDNVFEGGNSVVVVATSPETTLTNNTVDGSNFQEVIAVLNSPRTVVAENVVNNSSQVGVKVRESDGSVVRDNVVSNTDEDGVAVMSSHDVVVDGNDVSKTGRAGIYVDEFKSNGIPANVTVANNVVDETYWSGVYLQSSFEATVRNNTLTNSNDEEFNYGITLQSGTSNATVRDNTMVGTSKGLNLYYSENNTLAGNYVSDTWYAGIDVGSNSNNNTVVGNYVERTGSYVISVYNSDDTLIYDNVFNSTNGVSVSSSSGTVWNVSAQTGENVVGGPKLGGNYYATPAGDGFSETCTDADEDGFCDSSLTHATGEVDYLPLTTVEPTTEPAFFAVTITGTNSPVEPGQTLEVTTTVENTGSESGTQTVALLLDGTEVANQSVTLAGGESTTVTLAYATTGDTPTGTYTATVASADDSDSTTVEVSTTGEPDISLSPTSVDFGAVQLGDTEKATVTVTNDGSATLSVTDVWLDGRDRWEYDVLDNSAFTLEPGETRDVVVKFSPDSEGEMLARLNFASDDPDESSVYVALAGNGTDTGDTTPPTAVIEADATEVVVDETVTFDASASYDDGTIESIEWTFGDGTTATGKTVTHSYGDAGEYVVTLTVTDAAGNTDSATVTITVEERSQPTIRLPEVVVSGDAISFAKLLDGESATRSVTVRNVGDAALEVSGIEITGPGADAYQVDADSFTLQPGDARKLDVTATATAGGPTEATLAFETNDPNSPTVEVSLSHHALEPAHLVVEDATVDATEPTVGEEVTVDATLVNDGDVEGTFTVELVVDGTVRTSREITLGPGERLGVAFSVAFDEPGTYELALDDTVVGSLRVTPAETDTPTATPGDESPTATATPEETETPTETDESSPGFGAVVAVLALAAAALLARRRD